MIHHRKYDSALKKSFRLTTSERQRASEDGIAIIVRPQASGTYGVFALDIQAPGGAFPVGQHWYEVTAKREVPEAIRVLNRDLDKFHGLGGQMSWRGRHRDKSAVEVFEDALLARRIVTRTEA